MKFYVYLHISINDRVFYVGKGTGKRAWSTKSRNPYWKNIAKSGYRVEIVQSGLSEELSFELEKSLISKYKSTLTNMTDGGDGRSNFKWTKEQIEKRTKSVLGKSRANKGYKWTESQKAKLSRTLAGTSHKDSRKVIDEITGKIYHSAQQASKELNIPQGSIYKMLNGSRRNKTSLRYLEK